MTCRVTEPFPRRCCRWAGGERHWPCEGAVAAQWTRPSQLLHTALTQCDWRGCLAVVQVQTLPTVLLFPRNSDVFFKYRSPHRDAASLLRFMNSLCLRDGRPTWTLQQQVRPQRCPRPCQVVCVPPHAARGMLLLNQSAIHLACLSLSIHLICESTAGPRGQRGRACPTSSAPEWARVPCGRAGEAMDTLSTAMSPRAFAWQCIVSTSLLMQNTHCWH